MIVHIVRMYVWMYARAYIYAMHVCYIALTVDENSVVPVNIPHISNRKQKIPKTNAA